MTCRAKLDAKESSFESYDPLRALRLCVNFLCRHWKCHAKTRSPQRNLGDLARALRTEGFGQVPLYHIFVEQQLRLSGDDPLYDVVVDTMDLIWSGASAHGNGLFEDELSDERLARE